MNKLKIGLLTVALLFTANFIHNMYIESEVDNILIDNPAVCGQLNLQKMIGNLSTVKLEFKQNVRQVREKDGWYASYVVEKRLNYLLETCTEGK